MPVEIESDNSEDNKIIANLRALPSSSIFSELMSSTLGRLTSSLNSLKVKPSSSGATILGVPIYTLGGDKLRIRDNEYELNPEIYKASSFTGYTGKSMKNESDIFLMSNILNDLAFTGIDNRVSKRKTFFTKTLPKLVEKIENRTFDEFIEDSDDFQGQGLKIIIPSNIFDIYKKLEVLLGLKLSGHTNTLTEASALIDNFYKMGEIQNKQQYRNAQHIKCLEDS